MSNIETKFRVGTRLVPVTLEYVSDNLINLHFGFNRKLLNIVKTSFEGRKWLGPPMNVNGPKVWQIPLTQRNNFVLDHLQMVNPYKKYDDALSPKHVQECIVKIQRYEKDRLQKPLYQHQRELIAHALLTDTCIWAAEMGVGKTLSAYIYMEMSGVPFWWWVAPKSALRAFNEESRKWEPRVEICTMTYEELKSRVSQSFDIPQSIIFDESPKIKTPNAQRSIAARNLTNEMRDCGKRHNIVCMSGAPAPKSPLDWWHQCEVTEPGYLSEGSIFTFRETMGVFEDAEEGSYKKHVTWRDNVEKCDVCYELKNHNNHKLENIVDDDNVHTLKEGRDEVSRLNERLKGLVIFKLKKDCLDLPEKIFERRVLKPTGNIIKAARLIVKTSSRVIEALTRMRMLSDGFQYVEKESGHTVCSLCMGRGEYMEYYDVDEPDVYVPENFVENNTRKYSTRQAKCPNCSGTGRVATYKRSVDLVDCPKDEALIEDLSTHEEVGRLNVYAGFTASVDRVVDLCHKNGWTTIRADGRGWEGMTPQGDILNNEKLLYFYQECQNEYPLMCFVGQPGAAGEGLTLTAAHSTVFWSNDFNGNSRMQAEERGHRVGMDKERGGRIIDYLHLDSDLYVLLNLKEKKDLQRQSMTGLREFLGINNASIISKKE